MTKDFEEIFNVYYIIMYSRPLGGCKNDDREWPGLCYETDRRGKNNWWFHGKDIKEK